MNTSATKVDAVTAVSNLEKMRGLPWVVVMNTSNNIFAVLTLFGSAMVLFLNRLNFTNTQIGLTLGVLYITGIFSVFLIKFVNRVGYKRVFQIFISARAAVVGLLLLTPFVINRFSQNYIFWFIIAIVGLFAIFRTIALTGWMPWAKEYVPDAVRGKFTAISNISTSAASFLTVLVSGWVIGDGGELDKFMYLFAASILFAVISVGASRKVPGGTIIPVPGQGKIKDVLSTLKDNAFLLYLLGTGLITLGTEPMNAFTPLYLSEEVGLSDGNTIYIQAALMAGGILTSYLWGWAADRYGSKPVMMWGVFFRAVVPLLWFVIPRGTTLSLPLALGISFISGIAKYGFRIGVSRMLFVNIVPDLRSGDYMALFSTWDGITWGLSQITGGWILDLAQGVSGQLWIFQVDSYVILFLLAFIVPVISAVLLNRIKATSEVSTGKFASMFFHGNPIMAFNTMIRFQRAQDERAAVNLTERLGKARSPLTVEELLDALADPRFNVRFEAIVSIARTDPDPRLTHALCTMLERGEPALSVIAAWALGRIGDQTAIFALRDGLEAPYRSIQAHSARSLGTLQDAEVKAQLHRRLEAEKDAGLKIAYASALSKLGAVEAIPEILALLASIEDYFLRMEISLALGRLVSGEEEFVRLLRSVRQDPGMAASQVLIELSGRLDGRGKDVLRANVDQCIEAFSKNDLDSGVEQLAALTMSLDYERMSQPVSLVLEGCAQQLGIEGAERLDFLVLLLHTMTHNLETIV